MNKHAVEDSELSVLVKQLDLQMENGSSVLQASLERATGNPSKATRNQSCIRKLKTLEPPNWKELAELERHCRQYFKSTEGTEEAEQLHRDALSQLSFQSDWFRPLNQLPFLLFAMSLFKIWMVPAMALFMPLLSFILPYILMRFLWKIPISMGDYWNIMKKMWLGNVDIKSPKGLLQTALFLFSFAQGIIQPIQNARHYATTDGICLSVSGAILRLRAELHKLRDLFKEHAVPFSVATCLDTVSDDPRICFYTLYEHKYLFDSVCRNLSELELLWKFSQDEDICFVEFVEPGLTPYVNIQNLQDITIPKERRVTSSYSADKSSHHALLTGPNGGGKSSVLRALLQSILMAQTFGVAYCSEMKLRRFDWISSGIQLHDRPGKRSMFETEVYFAASILSRRPSLGFLFYDELFHSTNPPDAIRTAKIFLEKLWKKGNIASVVSTHVFEIVEAAPESVQRLCVKAEIGPNRALRFFYKLEDGICRVSSVETLLVRAGLLRLDESG